LKIYPQAALKKSLAENKKTPTFSLVKKIKKHKEFISVSIKIEKTDKALSAVGGLVIFKSFFDRLAPHLALEKGLPQLKRNSHNNFNKFKNLVMSFIAGADCLDDLDRLAQDDSFLEVNDGEVFTARSHGNFLRSFTPHHCKQLNRSLIDMSYRMRRSLFEKQQRMVIDFDSTSR
jgi:hypothetical protein